MYHVLEHSGRRGPGSLSSRVAGNVFIQVAVFEVDASLEWMPWQSELIQGLALQKEIKNKHKCQGLHYEHIYNMFSSLLPDNSIITVISRSVLMISGVGSHVPAFTYV